MSKQCEELLTLCGNDEELCKVVAVLDQYDMGGTASGEPGEYLLEGKEVLAKVREGEISSLKDLRRYLADIHKYKFDIHFNPVFRYRKLSAAINRSLSKPLS